MTPKVLFALAAAEGGVMKHGQQELAYDATP
jgi:hypothetical protein